MLEGCTPWPPEFAERYRRKGYWRGITIWDLLEQSAARWPDRCALVAGEERITYAQLVERSANLAGGLAALGFQPLDRVVLQLHNCPEFFYTFFALMRLGVIPVMALRAHRQLEIGHFLAHSKAVGYIIPDVIGSFDYRRMAEELRRDAPRLKTVVVAGEAGPGQASLSELWRRPTPPPAFRPDPGEVALMLLSGGTTAISKMIPRTHDDYVFNATLSSQHGGYGEDTVFLAMLPLGHNYSLASPGILGTLANGGRVVLAPSVETDTVFGLVEKERVTIMATAVPLVAAWVNSDAPERFDLSSLRVIQCGGSRLVPEMRRRLVSRFGCFHQEIFGTAEGLLSMVRLDDTEEHAMESSGAPICEDDEIRILGPDDEELPDGEAGELVVRGPYTIRGYYDAPDINAISFTADGFYRTGDVMRKQGRYLWAEGRKKDLVNRGGEKISTDEIENLAIRHPAVESVCVVAMPDEVFGEKACAFVVVKPGKRLCLAELSAFLLDQKIAKFKLPERLEVVEAFPVSLAGKVLRRELREIVGRKLAEEKAGASA